MTQFLRPLYGEYIQDNTIAEAIPLPQGVYAGMVPTIAGPGGASGWTASLSPDVDGFSYWRNRGTPSAGRYVIQETAAVTVAITAPDATYSRIDLIVGIHKWVAGPVDPGTLEPTGVYTAPQQATYGVVKGTAAATPNDPAVPDPWDAGNARAVILARVTVPITGTPTIERYGPTDLTSLPESHKRTGNERHTGGYFRVAQAPAVPEDVARLAEILALSAVAMPSGAVLPYAGPTAPTGFLMCDGSAVSRTTYSSLFAAISTNFGIGDGTTTFNVPDLRGRGPIGAGTGPTLTARSLGATGGEEAHLLATTEMPSHTHSSDGVSGINGYGTANTYAGGTPYGARSDTIGSTGGGLTHNNMQPFTALNFVIKT